MSLFALLLLAVLPHFANAQNVGVGTNVPNASALLEVGPTVTKGFLPPRVTAAQMLAIVTPATGLLVFNTSYLTYYYYDGTMWVPFTGRAWSLTGDLGTSPLTNFLGTLDANDLIQKTNSTERMRFFNGGDVGLTNTKDVAGELRFYEPSGSGATFSGFRAGVQPATVHYILPLGDGVQNQALVTDGAGNLSWHTFQTFGGGGADPEWARGSGTYSEYSLGTGNKTSGKYSIAGGDNNFVNGSQSVCWGDNGKVGGGSATISGGTNNDASGGGSEIRGGAYNSTSGSNGYIGGGQNNSVSGANATVVGGDSNSVSGQEAVILNGAANHTASQNDLIFGYGASLSGPNQLVFYCPTPPATKWGMNTYAPTEAADIVGNVKFSGAIKPNGAGGTAGQYLLSAGAGSPPTWGTITVPTTNWKLLGNSGTLPGTNFIGTTDANAFVIRTSATERMRILSTGEVGINTATPTNKLSSIQTGTTDETAAVYGNATGSTGSQAIGVWGRVDNTSSSNTGTIAVLALGNANSSSGTTNVALQISDGEFTTGRTTESPSKGNVVGTANSGVLYSDQGPAGVLEFAMQTDLGATSPSAGVYQDLGTVTVNNRYSSPSSIIIANVLSKINGGGSPDPKLAIYKVDVESRATGSFVIHIGMIPTATDLSSYQGSDLIRVGYVVINPGR